MVTEIRRDQQRLLSELELREHRTVEAGVGVLGDVLLEQVDALAEIPLDRERAEQLFDSRRNVGRLHGWMLEARSAVQDLDGTRRGASVVSIRRSV